MCPVKERGKLLSEGLKVVPPPADLRGFQRSLLARGNHWLVLRRSLRTHYCWLCLAVYSFSTAGFLSALGVSPVPPPLDSDGLSSDRSFSLFLFKPVSLF